MPTHPIGEKPMNSGERSARNLHVQRQEIADSRTILTESADLLLNVGRMLDSLGQKEEAYDCFKMAEIQVNQISIINRRLRYHENNLQRFKMPPRKGFTPPDPRTNLVITGQRPGEGNPAQLAYEMKRAALRPLTDAAFGHLARAEKASAE